MCTKIVLLNILTVHSEAFRARQNHDYNHGGHWNSKLSKGQNPHTWHKSNAYPQYHAHYIHHTQSMSAWHLPKLFKFFYNHFYINWSDWYLPKIYYNVPVHLQSSYTNFKYLIPAQNILQYTSPFTFYSLHRQTLNIWFLPKIC